MSKVARFTIRVYGLLIDSGRILLSYEKVFGETLTKFPGGGLEYGEGPLDCLRREFREESHLAVEPESHFYTTEDFVPSRWGENLQVLCIYYRVSCRDLSPLRTGIPGGELPQHGDQVLYWQPLATLETQEFSLPLDKLVAQKLRQDQNQKSS